MFSGLNIFEIISSVALLMIAYVMAFGLFIANKRFKQEKRSRTFELMMNFGLHEANSVSKLIHENFSELTSDYDEQGTSLAINAARREIFSYLNRFEAIAIGVMEGFYDEKILSEYLGTTLISTYREAQEFIEFLRNKSGNTRIFIHLEAIARRWERKRGID